MVLLAHKCLSSGLSLPAAHRSGRLALQSYHGIVSCSVHQPKNTQHRPHRLSFGSSLQGKQLSCHTAHAPRPASRRRTATAASKDEDVQLADRIVASLVYLVPLMDGLRYGRFFFQQFPFVFSLLSPIFPLFRLYTSFPFASLIVFYAIYAGIINNQQFTRFVRFNAMQAILLSIILILASVLLQIYPRGTLSSNLGLTVFINLNNAVWLYLAACVIYAVGSSLTGSLARLPLVSQAAEQRTPF